jgi:hypothetical protein
MAEDMGKAWKGQGGKHILSTFRVHFNRTKNSFPGGLQAAATSVGDMLAGETKSSGQKKSDAASSSLNELANGTQTSFRHSDLGVLTR